MEGPRYELHIKAHWAIVELARMIIEDFKKPETEAEFQKWRAEREAQRNQGNGEEDHDGNQKD